jgi:hypothetical protein
VRFKNELLLWDYGMELAEAVAASLVAQKKTPSDIIPYFHYVITTVSPLHHHVIITSSRR